MIKIPKQTGKEYLTIKKIGNHFTVTLLKPGRKTPVYQVSRGNVEAALNALYWI